MKVTAILEVNTRHILCQTPKSPIIEPWSYPYDEITEHSSSLTPMNKFLDYLVSSAVLKLVASGNWGDKEWSV